MGFDWFRDWIYSSLGRAAPAPPPPRGPLSAWAWYGRIFRRLVILSLAVCVLGGAGWYVLDHRHPDWAVIVVAGDWHSHSGGPSEAFDNARRDISAALVDIGFRPEDIAQFSVRPERYAGTLPSDAQTIAVRLNSLANKTQAGCLLYFTSHGTPDGMVMGETLFTPDYLARIVDETCGTRPAVIVVSACFSGTFVPALRGKNRLVITAARADRTSFGCGQDDKYPYFDTCVIANLRAAHSFPGLADRVRACVSKREDETGASPPSEPQVFAGDTVAARLPRW
jgi:hypothetical protein